MLQNKLLFTTVLCYLVLSQAFGQHNYRLKESLKSPLLPVQISWDDFGINIRMDGVAPDDDTTFEVSSSRYLEKMSSDLIRVVLGEPDVPVVIDLANFYKPETARASGTGMVSVTKPTQSLEIYEREQNFTFELINFSKKRYYTRQNIIIKGLNTFLIEMNPDVQPREINKKIKLDLTNSNTTYIALRGGLLQLADLEETIPTLCAKYNQKFSEYGSFVCVRDCIANQSEKELDFVRDLITKYNVTDFNDEPIAFLKQIIMTKNGIGLPTIFQPEAARFSKKIPAPVTKYKFYKWGDFINLQFDKSKKEKGFLILTPYQEILYSETTSDFSNVELIQFLNELRYQILLNINEIE